MKFAVEEALKEALEVKMENVRWMSERLTRLRKENGDPAKIAESDQWLARAVESVVQLREALGITEGKP